MVAWRNPSIAHGRRAQSEQYLAPVLEETLNTGLFPDLYVHLWVHLYSLLKLFKIITRKQIGVPERSVLMIAVHTPKPQSTYPPRFRIGFKKMFGQQHSGGKSLFVPCEKDNVVSKAVSMVLRMSCAFTARDEEFKTLVGYINCRCL